MPEAQIGENLLFGFVAVRLGLISHAEFDAASNDAAASSKSIGEILVERDLLSQADCNIVSALVEARIARICDVERDERAAGRKSTLHDEPAGASNMGAAATNLYTVVVDPNESLSQAP